MTKVMQDVTSVRMPEIVTHPIMSHSLPIHTFNALTLIGYIDALFTQSRKQKMDLQLYTTTMKKKRVKQLLEVLFFILLHAAFMCSSTFQGFIASTSQSQQQGRKSKSLTRNLTRSDNEVEEEEVIRPYNQIDIQSLRYNMKDIYPMLLVFNGSRFEAYTLGHEKVGRRYTKLVPLLVHALETNHPERFEPGQPVFQMVFTVSDFLLTECANEFADCPINKFLPPIVSFSSVYRDKSILPTAKSFPNPDFSGCLYEWKLQNKAGCTWPSVNKNLRWEELEDQLLWRGSDHRFFLPSLDQYGKMDVEWLEKVFTREALANMTDSDVVSRLFHHYSDLSPRWKAVALTLKSTIVEPESHHWINVLFTGTSEQELHALFAERGTPVTDKEPMSSVDMSRYRYQIDLAGGTWTPFSRLSKNIILTHHDPSISSGPCQVVARHGKEPLQNYACLAFCFITKRQPRIGFMISCVRGSTTFQSRLTLVTYEPGISGPKIIQRK